MPTCEKEVGAADAAGNFATFTFYYSRPLSRDPAFGIGGLECNPCGCLLQIRCRFSKTRRNGTFLSYEIGSEAAGIGVWGCDP